MFVKHNTPSSIFFYFSSTDGGISPLPAAEDAAILKRPYHMRYF